MLQPISQEQELARQDAKYKRIAPQAIQHIRYLLEDKQHFMNAARETGKIKRAEGREHKKEAYLRLSLPTSPEGQIWEAKGRGVKCRQCKEMMTMRNKVAELQDASAAKCPQAASVAVVGGKAEFSDKAAPVKQMLEGTLEHMADHTFSLRKHYIVCGRCRQRIWKHSAKEKLRELATSTCWDSPWTPPESWAHSM